ncbi:MAG: FAD-dependent oxidoreductase [Patescibacteria group bacterium]|nr:FAD-dependent oxidoreductase [Patescibacteria group bacterium]
MHDLIIIGAAAAGNSAAIYAARRKLSFKIITDNIGGEVALSGVINNWPGMPGVKGYELAQKFAEHAKSAGATIDVGWKVEKIYQEKNYLAVAAKNAIGEEKIEYAKSIIIASGVRPRKLMVPGEAELNRKGVTYCTVCDGPLFKNKITATVGSGNAALESALMMDKIAKKAYLISKYPNTKESKGGFPKGEDVLIEKVKSLANVEIIYGAITTEIIGKEKVEGLKYKNEIGEEKTIALDGILTHAGQVPNSQFIDCAEKDKTGQIIIDEKCRTSCLGIFAAGDVTNVPYKQIGIAVGQGIIASLAAIEHINKWRDS